MKISSSEWAIVTALARKVAFGDSNCDKKRFFAYLSKLEKKYGENADILATKADFIVSDKKAILLLQKAYNVALVTDDRTNCVIIADSLAQRFLYLEDIVNAEKWLNIIKKQRKNAQNYSYEDYKKIKQKLQLLKEELKKKSCHFQNKTR